MIIKEYDIFFEDLRNKFVLFVLIVISGKKLLFRKLIKNLFFLYK